jgi:aminopeptidase N
VTRRAVTALVLGLALIVVASGGLTWWMLRDDAPTVAATQSGAYDFPEPEVAEDDPALEAAVSTPAEDSYYPRTGDPGLDTLHIDLDLTWTPTTRTLTGVETLVFRATDDADQVQLDLGAPLEVEAVALDGEPVGFTHPGKDLVVETQVRADERYTLQVAYAGTPAPVPAPTTRSDFSQTGFTITQSDETWTMQEPFGAFTWYAVNDQPADKALYDFTLRVPPPWTGVANGTPSEPTEIDGLRVTDYHLGQPTASYLTTVAFGDYLHRTDTSASGTPLHYWVLRTQRDALDDLRGAKPALAWIERKLGPYPFDTAGILLTDSDSGMETQTLITLGNTPYTRSDEVIVHEMVHQWYGDLVTPTDWRDVWMNEGMTMYLQLVYRAEVEGIPIDQVMVDLVDYDQQFRNEAGPPGDYDPDAFGESNIYYCPALMWHELRQKVGDETFWRLVREWPQSRAFGNATRTEWFDWWEQESGQELTAFFDAWIDGATTPRV